MITKRRFEIRQDQIYLVKKAKLNTDRHKCVILDVIQDDDTKLVTIHHGYETTITAEDFLELDPVLWGHVVRLKSKFPWLDRSGLRWLGNLIIGREKG